MPLLLMLSVESSVPISQFVLSLKKATTASAFSAAVGVSSTGGVTSDESSLFGIV